MSSPLHTSLKQSWSIASAGFRFFPCPRTLAGTPTATHLSGKRKKKEENKGADDDGRRGEVTSRAIDRSLFVFLALSVVAAVGGGGKRGDPAAPRSCFRRHRRCWKKTTDEQKFRSCLESATGLAARAKQHTCCIGDSRASHNHRTYSIAKAQTSATSISTCAARTTSCQLFAESAILPPRADTKKGAEVALRSIRPTFDHYSTGWKSLSPPLVSCIKKRMCASTSSIPTHLSGKSVTTKDPAPICVPFPTRMFPRRQAPAPISTPSPISRKRTPRVRVM